MKADSPAAFRSDLCFTPHSLARFTKCPRELSTRSYRCPLSPRRRFALGPAAKRTVYESDGAMITGDSSSRPTLRRRPEPRLDDSLGSPELNDTD